jgi:hypothetical protein
MLDSPFRDARASALARADALAHTVARLERELAAAKKALARRPRGPRPVDAAVARAMWIATGLVVLMASTLAFGCLSAAASALPSGW